MGKILATLLIGLMLTASGRAADRPADDATSVDPLEDGIAAYQRGDFAAALQLFQRLAERGDASAQCNLGVMYEQGRGVAQNYREAMKWFRLAAVQGNASAQSNLGVMYYNWRRAPNFSGQPHLADVCRAGSAFPPGTSHR